MPWGCMIRNTFVEPLKPPQRFSRPQMEAWVREETERVRPGLPVRVVDTAAWSDYVNDHHFVPLTLEGIPANFKFDYNWDADKTKRQRLPSAEVTETGEFLFWGDRCNYDELDEKGCRDLIRSAVKHESGHFNQWQRIAISVLRTLGHPVELKKLPKTLAEIAMFQGAKEAFMRIWADGAHYQCREVEVITTQIKNDGIPAKALTEEKFKKRWGRLAVYAYGDENSPGCANSIWASEFSPYLEKVNALFHQYGLTPPQAKK